MRRFIASAFAGAAAFLLARGAGLPGWVDWPSDWTLRDAADVGVLTALAVWFALGWLRDQIRAAT